MEQLELDKEDKDMNNEVYFKVKEEMNIRFPYLQLKYRNMVVATAFAKNKKHKLTEDWVMKTLLMDVEDGFITYAQAVSIHKDYYKAIEEIKKRY
jgi:hypothetical protein